MCKNKKVVIKGVGYLKFAKKKKSRLCSDGGHEGGGMALDLDYAFLA